jgi:hypothetical protein
MKKVYLPISALILVLGMASCMVQQHSINTNVQPFQNGGRLFGESTKGLAKNTDYKTSHTMYVIGINTLSDSETQEMAKDLGADKYTVETKTSFIGGLCSYLTGGLVSGSKTTVFKRAQ